MKFLIKFLRLDPNLLQANVAENVESINDNRITSERKFSVELIVDVDQVAFKAAFDGHREELSGR